MKESATPSYFDSGDSDEDSDEPDAGVPSRPFAPSTSLATSPRPTNDSRVETNYAADEDDDDEAEAEERLDQLPPPAASRRAPVIPPHRNSTQRPSRMRSISDPFLDPGEGRIPIDQGPLSPPLTPNTSSPTPFFTSSHPAAFSSSSYTDDLRSPPPNRRYSNSHSHSHSRATPAPARSVRSTPIVAVAPVESPPPQFRIFTVPSYLTDPELRSLCAAFPDFITSGSRGLNFVSPSSTGSASPAVGTGGEEGGGGGEEGTTTKLGVLASAVPTSSPMMGPGGTGTGAVGGGEVKFGHGIVRIGVLSRDVAWNGTLWERFCAWWRALFGRS